MSGSASDRAHALELELCALGMRPEAASVLASDLVVRYPVARRGGLRALARRIKPRGLEPEAAVAAAALLLGIELYDAGWSFGQVHNLLLEEGVSEAVATNAAYDAARIQRSPRPERAPGLLSQRLVLAVTIASAFLALLLLR